MGLGSAQDYLHAYPREDTTTYSEKDIAFLPAGTAHTTRVVNGSPRVMFYELKD